MARRNKGWIDDFKLLLLGMLGFTLLTTFAAIRYQKPDLMVAAAGAAVFSAFLQIISRREPRDLPKAPMHALLDQDDIGRMTELIADNYELVLSFSYHLLRDPEDATFVTEQTFETAYRELILNRKWEAYTKDDPGAASGSGMEGYLLHSATSIALNLLRGRKVQPSRLPEAEREAWEVDRIEVPGVEVEDAQRELAAKLLKQSA